MTITSTSTRFFYPASRAHHAYCMAIDFGMQFKTRHGLWMPEGLPHLAGTNYQIEIAEESLHLLAPQRGDVIFTTMRGTGWVSVEMIQSELRAEEAKLLIKRKSSIIQRNGVPFHYPQSEES